MKFSQVKIGQRFRLDGQVYSKSGPLQAIQEGSDGHRMIMRSAAVTLLATEGESASPAKEAPIDRAALRQAVDRYHHHCQAILASVTSPLSSQADEQLTASYQELLKLIDR